jgi:hypothetical protein
MNLTILVANYNTPQETEHLLRSVKYVCEELPNVVVINSSDTCKINEVLLEVNKVPYYNARGFSHGEAVNLGLSKVKTRYVLLVDSDVLFLKDFKPAFQKFVSSGAALMGKVVGDCAGKSLHPRVEPWFCFMDLDQIKKHKIKFFDRDRHMKRHLESVETLYDVGSTMFEDILKHDLIIADVKMEGKYFKHYGGMSWHIGKFDPNIGDTDIDIGGTHPNKALFDHGVEIRKQYVSDISYLKDVNIKGVYSNE